MALQSFTVTIVTKTDAPFNILPNAPIEIRERLSSGASGGLSLIFSDSAGTIPITQTGATTNSLGQLTFFAAAADYNAVFDNQGTPVTIAVDVGVTGGVLNSRIDRLNPDTVAIMIADASIEIGDVVSTLGYITKGDGGDNRYEIVAAGTGTDDGGAFIDLLTFQAKGLFPGGIRKIRQYGASGNNIADDRAALAAIDANGSFLLTKGIYKIASNITFSNVITHEQFAILEPEPAVTVTLNQLPIAGMYRIWGDLGTFNGTLGGTGAEVRISWYGTMDGINTAAAAIINARAMQDSVNNFTNVFFDHKLFVDTKTVVPSLTNIRALGRVNSIEAGVSTNADFTILEIVGGSRIEFEKLEIDGNEGTISFDVKGIEFIGSAFYFRATDVTVIECFEAVHYNNGANVASNHKWTDCILRDSNGIGGNLHITGEIQQIDFNNITLRSAKGDAEGNLVIDSPNCNRVKFTGGLIDESQVGVGVLMKQDPTRPVQFNGVDCSDNVSFAYHFKPGSRASINGGSAQKSQRGIFNDGGLIKVVGVDILDNTDEGIRSLDGDDSMYNSNLIKGNGTGILLQNGKSETANDNTVLENDTDGMVLQNTTAASFKGNTAKANGQAANDTHSNIRVLSGANNVVQANTTDKGLTTNKSKFGVRIEAAATGTIATDNKVSNGGVTDGLSDAGTGTVTASGNN